MLGCSGMKQELRSLEMRMALGVLLGDKGTREQGKGVGWTAVQLALSKAAQHQHAASVSLFKPQKDLLRSPARSQLPKLGWLHC